jgi:hypothetical protein
MSVVVGFIINFMHMSSNFSHDFIQHLQGQLSSKLTFAQTTKAILSYAIIRKLYLCNVLTFDIDKIIKFIINPTTTDIENNNHEGEQSTSTTAVEQQHSSLNPIDMESTSTIPIVQAGGYQMSITRAYVERRLSENSENLVKLGIPSIHSLNAINKLISEFEKLSIENDCEFNQKILLLGQETTLTNDENQGFQQPLSPSTEQKNSYFRILNRVLDPNCNVKWSRIVALLSFTSELVLREVRKQNIDAIYWYIDWGTSFILQNHIHEWIQQQPNGWEDLVTFALHRVHWDEEILKIWKVSLAVSLTSVAFYATFKLFKSLM